MSQTPLNFRSRLNRWYQTLIEPHPSITNVEDLRKAELLSIITIIISSLLIVGLIFASNIEVFVVLLCFTVSTYLFSRTANYWFGSYLFTYAFTTLGFITIYRGTASSVDIAVATIVHMAIVFSSVLLSQRAFLLLVVLATAATVFAPMYSTLPPLETDSFARTGGTVLTIGLVLYGINNFRVRLEKEQVKKLTDANIKLEELTTSQEERIQERTQELEDAGKQIQQRALRLQNISDISQEIVSNISQKPDEVLERITQTISKKLGYYHVGIFLLDKDGEFAVLRAANSRGGQKMLTRRHQLKVGATGIVGYVTQSGRPRIALDTSSDVVFFNNPDLPETRSEIALPLKYGETILGALDVQSTLPSAFTNEDVDTLSALANQVAIVIKNLQMTEDSKYLALNRSLSSINKNAEIAYSFQPDGSITTTKLPEDDLALQKVTTSGETVILTPTPKRQQTTLAVPVKFRDRIVGVIHIEVQDEKKKWSEDEVALVQAISDRAAFALENARLLEDSQRRATKEQAIGEISTKISANTDIEAILRTAVRELGAQISGTQITVEIGSGNNGNNNHTA
jgi:GAF domain-containing protein